MATKEWRGNKKSVSVNNGMATTWHPENRAAGDYYTTDPSAVEALVPYLKRNKIANIWECACGCGNISKVLEQNDFNVLSTDLHDRGYGISGVDFLISYANFPNDKNIDAIITNPPYSLADEFILHAMDILPNECRYIALQNINYLAGQKRYKEIYSKCYLESVLVFSNRIHCYKNNVDTGCSSPVNYAWFVYYKSDNIPYLPNPSIQWLSTK